MDLRHYLTNPVPVTPWSQGENIPWDDPAFSERMLAEHLDDSHDMASRRSSLISEHVAWINRELLGGEPSRVLDLACGPGLYLNALAKVGHRGVGIDFSPAAIRYATQQATELGLLVDYVEADVRTADFGTGFDLAMMVFGQINVFRRDDMVDIVQRAHDALARGGILLLEPHRPSTVRSMGETGPTWEGHATGLFSARPHLVLVESAWDESAATATQRFAIVDAETADVTVHALSTVAYRDDQLVLLLEQAGFTDIRFHESLTGQPAEGLGIGLYAITARAGDPGARPSGR